ncbi:MAG: response regulator, partial [bacterium]
MDELKLRILIVEDIQDDAELVARELLQDGMRFDWRRVVDETGFLRELAEFSPDLILADYALPSFDAMSALRILQETGREIPFILVTDSQSEETAAAVMREGADDYILKSNLMRLPSSVRHALERWETKRALRESEEFLSNLLEYAPVSIHVTGADGRMRLVNRRWE